MNKKVKKGNVTIVQNTALSKPKRSSASNGRSRERLRNNKDTNQPTKIRIRSQKAIKERIKENRLPVQGKMLIKGKWEPGIPNDRTLVEKNITEGNLVQNALWCTVCKIDVHEGPSKCRDHLLTNSVPKGHIYKRELRDKENTEINVFKNTLRNFVQKKIVDNFANFKNVSDENHEFRADQVKLALSCGIPRHQFDKEAWKAFFDKWCPDRRGCASTHSAEYIEFLQKMEDDSIKAMIDECYFCTVIFDGTTRADEVFCIVLRFVKKDCTIVQKLVSLKRYESAKTSEQLVYCIRNELSERYGIQPKQVIAFQKDRAAVNDATINLLYTWYYYALNLHCLSHTLCHVGEHMHSTDRIVDDLVSLLKSMLGQGGGANKSTTRWFYTFNESWKEPGNTRWWATYELIIYLYGNWDKFLLFVQAVRETDDVATLYDTNVKPVEVTGKRVAKLRALLDTPAKRAYMKLELGVVSIAAKPLIEGTYILEGDGPTSLVTYDVLFHCFCHLKRYAEIDLDKWSEVPSDLKAIIDESVSTILGGITFTDKPSKDELRREHMARTRVILAEAFRYFKSTIYDFDNQANASKLKDDIATYEICRLFDPIGLRAVASKPTWSDVLKLTSNIWDASVDSGKRTPFFEHEELSAMSKEWSVYLQLVSRVQTNEEDGSPNYRMEVALDWWRNADANRLPNLCKFARYCINLVSSSGAAERVFSRLKNYSMVQMKSSYEDVTELQVMSQFNHNM